MKCAAVKIKTRTFSRKNPDVSLTWGWCPWGCGVVTSAKTERHAVKNVMRHGRKHHRVSWRKRG